MRKPIIIIEHLEPEFSIWLFLEYRHSSLIYGSDYIWYTSLPLRYHKIMKKYGKTYEESIIDLVKQGYVDENKIIILDPAAEEKLSFKDLVENDYVIIGGILGDHPPRKRTEALLSKRLRNVKRRNIGDGQYSIDGAVYFVNSLWYNKSSEKIQYIDGVTLETEYGYIRLPFRYPIIDGKPLLSSELVEYLKTGRIPENIKKELGLT
ncbi:Protein of unknown function DUF431 [Staphylothermus marinus F1]|uniref:SAM-dependent MTase TRM10-type domain-containing protein n=1 Tax=Staphylothermus marinus (strain ATCC 43588 / DSM 3639 / JCM 9404 / F1) TaxID=399550 RepID=A3DP32_STAMF|nr:SAM-dependent methyltransferase [Staphylothermus marinus]ABN70392.1 Protein of unknown function DUF431 [Staphylothermus marinus F1]